MSTVQALFLEKRESIAKAWFEAIVATMPLQSSGFLRTLADPFVNPVADMLKEAMAGICDALSGQDLEIEIVKQAIERLILLQAAENTPGKSLATFLILKPILQKQLCTAENCLEYLEFESRLDTILLLAFDLYMAKRETMAELRINEIKRQHAHLVQWAQNLEAQDLKREVKEEKT